MEPEDVVHVLRHLLKALAAGGRVVDLASVPPDGVVEHEGRVVGTLDERAFFSRTAAGAGALDLLVAEKLLAPEHDERFPVRIHYPSGLDAVEDVSERTYGRMSDELAARVRAISGAVVIREENRVRSFRKPYSK